jgi:hypothetical protein
MSMPKVFHIHFDVIVSTNIFEDWVVWIKSFCLWDIQASNLTLVAKLIQGHKYRDVYVLYLLHAIWTLFIQFSPSWLLNHKAFLVSAAENYHCHL